MKKKIKVLLFGLLLSLLITGSHDIANAQNHYSKKVLYINSYHKGYKWSDEILEGIESKLMTSYEDIEISVEYMDTKRIEDKDYIEKLEILYERKFRLMDFDIIMVSDNAAFEFLIEYGESLFPNTPVVFCGVNNFKSEIIKDRDMFTGVVENSNVLKTVETVLRIHPDTKNIYYINDNTLTGQLIANEIDDAIAEFGDSLDFIRMEGKDFSEIEKQAGNIPENSIILFLSYSKDNSQNYIPYDEGISRIERQSNVPIYGVLDFQLKNGIVGGMLTSGYHQGEEAAKIGLRILSGESPSDIPVITENNSSFKFDYEQLKKFKIPLENLPADSIIVNRKAESKKHILILHSYNKGSQWTDDIEAGIKAALKEKAKDIEFTYEYMDVKKNSDPVYIHKAREFIKEKHLKNKFDVVILTDDEAFRFASNYNDSVFENTPVVFCGVNYFEDSMLYGRENFTGVVESSDFKSTIDIALKLHPYVKKVVVINDNTLSGQGVRKNIDKLVPKYSGRVNFEFWEDINMSDIQNQAAKLGKDSIIMLLSFSKDKSFNQFSYGEAIKLISESSSVPVYSSWDLYMGNGLMGGMLTSGYTQGETAGRMVKRILEGESPSDMPVKKNSPNRIVFDYKLMNRFGISKSELPRGSKLINPPFSLDRFQQENKEVFAILSIMLWVIIALFAILYLQIKNMRIRKDAEEKERTYAMTDALTGVFNRRACFEHLERLVEEYESNGKKFAICFLDVNGLKTVNDSFGHSEGDELINTVCRLIRENVRSADILYRLGGDEFLIAFDGFDVDMAAKAWGRVQEEIDRFNGRGLKPYDVSASAGFAEYDNESYATIDELIEKADKEMYACKAIYKRQRASQVRVN